VRGLLPLVLVGCGFQVAPGAPADGPGSSDAFDAPGDPDAPIDASIDGPATPLDGDGDTILDTVDNCPAIGNTDQHNEDADPRGDACDPCPYLANAALEEDGDGDSIGNACDPHPASPDVVVLFDPFKTAGPISTTWVHSAGTATWSISGDALRVAAGTGTEIIRYPTTARPHTIDLSVTVEAATGGGGSQSFVTALTDVATDIGEYFGCGFRLDPPAIRELFDYDSDGDPQFAALGTSNSNPPVVGAAYRIRLQTDPSNQACSLPGVNLNASATANANPSVGIRARNVTMRIQYVAIYRSP
jgi:hypothetical protein